jgi:GAF domain-containing protein
VAEYYPAELATAATFAAIAVHLHDAECVEDTVEATVAWALQAVRCDYAGVALMGRGGRLEIAAVTDPVVETIYRFQLLDGDGPLIAAAREEKPVRVRDAATETRWPRWAEMITGLGVHSVVQVPMLIGGQVAGVLSAYGNRPDAFSDDDEAVAQILARHASIAVTTARRQSSLAQAVDARKLIGEAMGILMERFDLDGDRAFEVLKRYSQDTNTKLRDVAACLIETRRLPASDQPLTRPRLTQLIAQATPSEVSAT